MTPVTARINACVHRHDDGIVVAELTLRDGRYGPDLGQARYYVASSKNGPLITGTLIYYPAGACPPQFDTDAGRAFLADALRGFDFRRAPNRGARTRQGSRRDLALRLALQARDALAAEVLTLRRRVDELEQRASDAERWADSWQDVAERLQAQAAGRIALTQNAQLHVLPPEHVL